MGSWREKYSEGPRMSRKDTGRIHWPRWNSKSLPLTSSGCPLLGSWILLKNYTPEASSATRVHKPTPSQKPLTWKALLTDWDPMTNTTIMLKSSSITISSRTQRLVILTTKRTLPFILYEIYKKTPWQLRSGEFTTWSVDTSLLAAPRMLLGMNSRYLLTLEGKSSKLLTWQLERRTFFRFILLWNGLTPR